MIEKGHVISVLDKGFVRYIDHFGSDERVCEAARISYRAPSKGEEQDQKLINYLWRNQHTSPFEQVNITFNIKLPLFVQGQLVRHRMQRLNQVSARYTEMVDEFYIPNTWRKQDIKNKQGSIVSNELNNKELSYVFEHECLSAYYTYKYLINNGVAREMARMVLPQNIYTEIYSNWDLNNLLRFFTLRLDKHAQLEIQEYAKAMYDITEQVYPKIFKAYKKYKVAMIEVDKENNV